MSEKERKKVSGKRIALILLIVFLAIVLVVLVAGTIFITDTLNKISRPEQNATLSPSEIEALLNEGDDDQENPDNAEETEEIDPSVTEETLEVINPEDLEILETPVDQITSDENKDNFINILLVGQDARDPDKRQRSDSMILCTLNKSTKTLTMTSFMRDMYVKIPEYYNQRMNVAYMVGGFDALYDTLEYNFGVEVNQGVAVNFQSFTKVVDAVGGVDIELSDAEARYINSKDSSFGLKEGMNHLSGAPALWYARTRKVGGGGDFDRSNRQRILISAIIDKLKALSLIDLYNLVDELLPMVYTDMSNAEIVAMVIELAPMLQDLQIVSQRIPLDDGYRMTMIDGMSVLLPDLQKSRDFLAETIGGI